jgi:Protein of unknown function (DUF2723)
MLLSFFGSGCVLALVLAIYVESGFQSIPGGDSGELAAEACGGGVAHPPGYPLFILLGNTALKAWESNALPPILVLNRVCAALGALSAAFHFASVFLLVTIIKGREQRSVLRSVATVSIAVGVGLSTAFAPLLWLYNTQTEVFALNNAFVAVLLWILLKAVAAATAEGQSPADSQRGLHRWLCVGAVFSGLSLCNQHTSILLIAPVMIYCLGLWLWLFSWRLPSLPRSLTYGFLLFVGLLPYAWLPISHGLWRVPGSWGDTTTIKGFIRHFLRQDYGTFRLISKDDGKGSVEGPMQRHIAYWQEIKEKQLTYVALGLAIVGVIAAVVMAVGAFRGDTKPATVVATTKGGQQQTAADKKPEQEEKGQTAFAAKASLARQTFPSVLVLFLAFYFIVFHGLSNMSLSEPLLYGVHARFWMQPTYLVTLLTGFGAVATGDAVTWVWGRINTKSSAEGSSLSSSSMLSSFAALVLGSLLTATSFNHMLSNYHGLDNSGNDALARYGLALLEPLPPNATLITGFDMQWTAARYLQVCEGVRKDVNLLNAPVMSFSWFESHRRLYKGVSFPGTHLVSHLSATHASGGFSLADFFVANIAADRGRALVASYDTVKPHPQFIDKRPAMLADPLPEPFLKSATASSNLYYSGVFVFNDQDDHNLQFELRPFGIVSHVVPKYAGAHTRFNSWRNITKSIAKEGVDYGINAAGKKAKNNPVALKEVNAARKAWANVETVAPSATPASASIIPLPKPLSDLLPNHTEFVGLIKGSGIVNHTRYDETTWELATRIDTWNQAISYATWLLEWALDPSSDTDGSASDKQKKKDGAATDNTNGDYVHPGAAMEALRILEQGLVMQKEHNTTVVASTYKNIGLACMKLVRGNKPAVPDTKDSEGVLLWPMLPLLKEAGLSRGHITEEAFRNAASQRVLDTWSIYLVSPESKKDPGAPSIRNVVNILRDVANKQQQAQAQAKTKAAQQAAAGAPPAASGGGKR